MLIHIHELCELLFNANTVYSVARRSSAGGWGSYSPTHLQGKTPQRNFILETNGWEKKQDRVGYICAYPPYESACRFPPRAHFSGRVPRSIALIWPPELARFACHAAYGVNYNAHADAAAPALVSITTKRGGDTGRTTFTKKKLTARLGPGGWEYIE